MIFGRNKTKSALTTLHFVAKASGLLALLCAAKGRRAAEAGAGQTCSSGKATE